MFSSWIESRNQKHENIYLIRNEREIKIYDKFGGHLSRTFYYSASNEKENKMTYQVFIERKGKYLKGQDK